MDTLKAYQIKKKENIHKNSLLHSKHDVKQSNVSANTHFNEKFCDPCKYKTYI